MYISGQNNVKMLEKNIMKRSYDTLAIILACKNLHF